MTLTCKHWREAEMTTGGRCETGKFLGRTISIGVCRGCDKRAPDDAHPIQPLAMTIKGAPIGAGDSVKRLFDAVGVGAVAKFYEKMTGRSCGCPLRQKWLNRNFPRVAGYFDRVVVISLARTPERLATFAERAMKIQWPLREPLVFEAIDGNAVPVPSWFTIGGPAWGCLQSHRRVVEQAIADKVERLIVFEDDAGFATTLGRDLRKAIKRLPGDWDQLMIGGQQMHDGYSKPFAPGLNRVTQCERTHAYALSAKGMRSIAAWWSREADGHVDWRMGDWQALPETKAYSLAPFAAYQAANFSTLRYREEPDRGLPGMKSW